MQKCSKEYKQAMKKPLRNRAFIHLFIGIVNSEAQKTISTKDTRNKLLYLSNTTKPFAGYKVEKQYATAEEGFTRADGSFFFSPVDGQEVYNQGIVTQETAGTLYLVFSTPGLDIKGLTIDFGHCYPTEFSVTSDSGTKTYQNDSEKWSTRDAFFGTSFLVVKPLKMRNGNRCRMRIREFICGISETFTNKEVQSYSFKDFVSPIAETLPSQDMTVKIGNTDRYYCVDNPESTVNFMEEGMQVYDLFGYELDDGSIEQVVGHTTYLSRWDSDDKTAQFTTKDRFCYLNGIYRKGRYREQGITAYDLGTDIFRDAGVDERDYFLDPYLKNVMIYNPMPPVSYPKALQILANACRCILSISRQGQMQIKSSFIPEMTVSAGVSNPQNLLSDSPRDVYAMAFRGFTRADGDMLFLPAGSLSYSKNTGYVSELLSDANGRFSVPPVIAVNMEAAYTCFKITFRFHNVTPTEFFIRTYYEGHLLETYTVENPTEECTVYEEFLQFDRIAFEFTKAAPYSRIVIDSVLFDEVTNDYLELGMDLMEAPKSARIEKTRNLDIIRTVYAKGGEKSSLSSDEIEVSPESNRYLVEFSKASYGIAASVAASGVSVRIAEQSDYYALLEFSGMTGKKLVKYDVSGYQYIVTEQSVKNNLNPVGIDRTWKNPLISTGVQAAGLMEWLGDYYLGDVEYQIKDRGDPRQDANDIFYLEIRDREKTQVRAHQIDLKFSGAWSSTKKARKVVHGKWRGEQNRKPTG